MPFRAKESNNIIWAYRIYVCLIIKLIVIQSVTGLLTYKCNHYTKSNNHRNTKIYTRNNRTHIPQNSLTHSISDYNSHQIIIQLHESKHTIKHDKWSNQYSAKHAKRFSITFGFFYYVRLTTTIKSRLWWPLNPRNEFLLRVICCENILIGINTI